MPPIRVDDARIANDLLEMTKGSAVLTTTHYLECVTPEVQNILKRILTHCLQTHDETTEIAVKNGWYPAYQSIAEQLQNDLTLVKGVRSTDKEFS